MKFTLTHTFDYPVEKVWDMFHDPEAHVAKFAAMGHQEIEVVSSEVSEYELDITISRKVEMEIPAVAKKFLPPTNTVISTDHWEAREDGSFGGHFEVDVQGVPSSSSGITELVAIDDDSCSYTVELEVKVNIPLVGDRIAKAIKPQLEAQLLEEFRADDEWLASR